MVAFEIPGEPVAHARSRSKAGQAPYLPRKQADYGNLIRLKAQTVMAGALPTHRPVSVRVRAVYVAPSSWSRKRRETTRFKTSKPDADNLLKIVCDGMNNIVFADDSQVVQAFVEKVYGLRACMIVEVSPA